MRADDGFVGRHRNAGDARKRAARAAYLLRVHAGLDAEDVGAGAQRHDYLLEGGVAGAFADAVDGAFDLRRPGAYRGDGVRDREPHIVVAVGGEPLALQLRNGAAQIAYQLRHLGGHGVADGVGHVDGGGARVQRGAHAQREEFAVAAGGVLEGVFHVAAERTRVGGALGDRFKHLLARHTQLALHVQV